MMAHDSIELLRRFIRDRSETAFRGLVELHSPLVYATALRRLAGDRAAAQDVTQEVFTLLARKAASLQDLQLGGWLYRQSCRRAANHVRTESRRRAREAVAAMAGAGDSGEDGSHPDLAGEVDEAMLSLHRTDRDALVLRFLEARDFRNVGGVLGISEEAARKRVGRALEKLCALLKRRGIAVGSAALGTSMNGMAATPVPAGLVSTVSAHALKSASLGGSFAIWPLAKAVFSGVLASSLLGGVALIVRPPEKSTAKLPLTVSATTGVDPRANPLGAIQADASLDALITEIQRVRSGPGNSITSLRLNAILERIRNEQIPEFVALGNLKLSAADRKETYPRLLERWAKTEPEAALAFTLDQKIDQHVNADRSSNLLNNLHQGFARRDPAAASAWLMRNWDHPLLLEDAFYGKWRTFMSCNLAEVLMERDGVAATMNFIRSLPSAEESEKVLRALCGPSSWHDDFITAPPERIVEIHRALMTHPDEDLRRELIPKFWGNVANQRPDEVTKLLEDLDVKDRFLVHLGLLRATQKPGERIPAMHGGTLEKPARVDDRKAREQAALEAGMATGLTREETLAEMLPEVMWALRGKEGLAWFDTNRGTLNADEWLASRARELLHDNSQSDTEAPHVEAIQWASRISDPELRLRLSRAAFRRSLLPDKGPAVTYLERNTFPPDLAAEFRKILGEAP